MCTMATIDRFMIVWFFFHLLNVIRRSVNNIVPTYACKTERNLICIGSINLMYTVINVILEYY